MNLQVVYQNSNPLFKTNILHTVYLINENNEHCIMTNKRNLRPKRAGNLSILQSLV